MPGKVVLRGDVLKRTLVRHWPFFITGVLSFLLPAVWLRKGSIAYAETAFTFLIDPSRLFNLSRYVWWDAYGTGIKNVRALPSCSYHLLVSILKCLVSSPVARQYLIFSMVLLVSSFAMYYLVLEISEDHSSQARLTATVTSLFYVLNPFTMNWVWHRFASNIFGLPFLPLVFLIVVKLLKKPSFYYACLLAVAFLLFSINAINPAYLMPLLIAPFLYVAFETIMARRLKAVHWKNLGLALLLTVGFNFWWILPLFVDAQSAYSRAAVLLDSADTLQIISSWTPLLFIFRLIDSETIHWFRVNYHPGWVEFLIPVVALASLLFGRRNKNTLFFGFLMILGLFLGKGLQTPGSGIFDWIFSHVPFFWVFRNPFEKFGLLIAFSYSFLIGTGVGAFWETKVIQNGILKVVLITAFLLAILGVAVWPMWTGDVFSFFTGAISSTIKQTTTPQVEIPSYYYEASRWLHKDRADARVVFLPQSHTDGVFYKWEHGYAGADFGSVNLLFDKPIISQFSEDSDAEYLREIVFDKIFWERGNMFPVFMGLMNTRYVLVRNDVDYETMKIASPDRVNRVLDSMPSMSQVGKFGKLTVYRLNHDYFRPHIYTTSKFEVLVRGVDSVGDALNPKDLSNFGIFFLLNQREILRSVSIQNAKEVRLTRPTVSFEKLNPTLYRVKVKDAQGPFFLVLSESFDQGWRAYEGHVSWFEALWKRPIGEDRHLRANVYANGWYLDKRGDVEITLYFWPQTLVYLGTFLSTLIVVGSLVFLFYDWRKRGARGDAVNHHSSLQ